MKRKKKDLSPSPERLEILERIRRLEAEGGESFYVDVEPDPSGHQLRPDEVDYLQKKVSSKFKAFWARRVAAAAQPKLRRHFQMKILGEENLAGIRGGAILTSNHFGMFENMAVKEVADRVPGKHKFWRVIKGLNYFQTGWVGFLMKNCDTLPLSENLKTSRLLHEAMGKILADDGLVLVYPEQAMWWNYRKPRPFKPGAFFFAAKFNVPIIPIFVTMSEIEGLDMYHFPRQAYTVHIMPPIYPNPEKTLRENEREMLARNQQLCNDKYREVYGKDPNQSSGVWEPFKTSD